MCSNTQFLPGPCEFASLLSLSTTTQAHAHAPGGPGAAQGCWKGPLSQPENNLGVSPVGGTQSISPSFKMDGREKETGKGRGKGREEGRKGRGEGGDKRGQG